jgi:4-hydroxybenzoate polyprenyltransferase
MFKGLGLLYLICIGFFALLVIAEFIISSLKEENKIKKWWRKNVIAEYNQD